MHRALAVAFVLAIAHLPAFAQAARAPFEILVPGKGWELVGDGYQLTADSTVDRLGNIYFTDAQHDRIFKVDLQGKITTFKEGSHHSHGIAFGPDGRLYAGQHDLKRIVAFSMDGTETAIAEEIQTHHLTVTARNDIYCTQAPDHKVWLLDTKGGKRVVDTSIPWPRGVRATTDQSRLLVNDGQGTWVWSFQIQPDGSLTEGKPAYQLAKPAGSADADASGMTFDSEGFLYVATRSGVQIFDRQARPVAAIAGPSSESLTTLLFAGTGLKWLYAAEWNKLYRRPVMRSGAAAFDRGPQ